MHEYGRLGCTVSTESDDVEQLHLLSHCRERARRATVYRAKLDNSRRALPHVDPINGGLERTIPTSDYTSWGDLFWSSTRV